MIIKRLLLLIKWIVILLLPLSIFYIVPYLFFRKTNFQNKYKLLFTIGFWFGGAVVFMLFF